MTTKQQNMRLIRLFGIADSKGGMVPIFASRVMNMAIIAYGDKVVKDRTARRYRRADNRLALCDQ